MNRIEDLEKAELEHIVFQIQVLLFGETTDSKFRWNGDKEWSVDLLEDIGAILDRYKLVPETGPIVDDAPSGLTYKCPACGATSTAEDWNDMTARDFGTDVSEITPIQEGIGSADSEYTCPKCYEANYGNEIR